MGIKVGICGAGAFAACFVPLFKAHPLVGEVALADLIPERANELAARNGVTRILGSLDDLCASDVDAIVLMTQRQLHGPQAAQALRAGKHVYSAVPIGQTVEDIRAIAGEVLRTRLIYMTGETSYYYPCALYCRKRFRQGDFGKFVYGEGEYHHDMRHFYKSFQRSGGPDWKRVAGFPPMFYPTHSVSLILSVTGARAVTVSCLGFRDQHEDGVFGAGANLWDNPFSNETALMRTSDGGSMRINEFRRIGWKGMSSVQMSLFGTKGSFEEQANSQVWSGLDPEALEPLNELLACGKIPIKAGGMEVEKTVLEDFHQDVSKVHPVGRLPRSFAGLGNGHQGSHQFLVDDFVKAVTSRKLPPNHVWAAARYCIPGLVAHQSAEQNGALLDIPDLGNPPADWPLLDPDGAG
jgi:predicted dehydrogenase